MKKRNFLFLFTLFAIILISCDRKSNEQIDIDNFNAYKKGNPDNEVVNDNDTLTIVANIKSRSNLKSYKIDIHYGEGHSHDNGNVDFTPITDSGNNSTSIFTFSEIVEIEGDNYNLNKDIVITPKAGKTTKPGEYHVTLNVIDIKGNSKSSTEKIHINEHDHD